MTKFYFTALFFFISFLSNAQAPFITTWEVEGTSQSQRTIRLPIIANPSNNFTIDFGDGIVLTNPPAPIQHIYAQPGTYTVAVHGNFYGIAADLNMATKIRTVEQWGSNVWKTMQSAFSGCSFLTLNATDAPNLTEVTIMTQMFSGAKIMNQPINHWDVSNVTNMIGMFANTQEFNQPLNNWDVSNVTQMNAMFSNAQAFNQPLDNWNVSNVTSMSNMFKDALLFNQPIGNWDVSNVVVMSRMFTNAISFNKPLDAWDVSNVNYMVAMFELAMEFNQPLNNWNVSSVIDMTSMFKGAPWGDQYAFNQPLNNWDVSNVYLMSEMFYYANNFNQPLYNWDVSHVGNMQYMFGYATNFNQPLNTWDVSNVFDMRGMFMYCSLFNQPLDNWDVLNVDDMMGMFTFATSFNQPLNSWDVSNVHYLTAIFQNASSFNQPLNNWSLGELTDYSYMFNFASSFNQDLSSWNFTSLYQGSNFVSNSGLDTDNYDALLLNFAQGEFEDIYIDFAGLQYCNATVRNYLITEKGWTITGDTADPACIQNTLTGFVRYDSNTNGCDAGDIAVTNFLVNASSNNLTYGASVAADGIYDLKVADETYTVTLANVPNYFTVNPASTTVSFTNFGNTENLNFCLTANQTVNDLNVTLLPITEARPGFTAEYQLVVQNMGTQNVANATVVLTYDATKQTFVSAVPTTSATASGQLTFAISNLQALQTRRFDLVMQTLVPPIVNGGDVLNFAATVTPNASDATPQDNTFALAQTAINSYDPNDKQVLQGDEILIEDADQYLDYVIRFQNTGSASAIFVRIEDELHENLDWNTLKMVSASHEYRVEITDGNHVEFIFDNINLPHEAANAAGSNGFIAYKIKPKQTAQVGDIMSGNASIFFDYNLPIITNSVSTEVVLQLNTPEFVGTTVRVYPNPTDGKLYIQTNGEQVLTATVFSLQGKELLQFNSADAINIDRLSAGIYLLEVNTDSGKSNFKIVRK